MNKSKKINKVGDILWLVFISLLLIALVANAINMKSSRTNSLKGGISFFGYRPVIVVSGSMLPAIQINSISIMKYCDIDDINEGEIAMYYNPTLRINITHRVIEKNTNSSGETYIVTKGDNNEYQDTIEITDDIFVGKLVKTFNNVAPLMSLFIHDEGQIDSGVLLLLLVIISTLITLVYTICFNIASVLVTVIICHNSEWFIKYTKNFETSTLKPYKLRNRLLELQIMRWDTPRVRLAKLIEIKSIERFADELTELEENKSKAAKIGGKGFEAYRKK